VICPLCDKEHDIQEHDWPTDWDSARTVQFLKALTTLGVDKKSIPSMANEINRLNKETSFHVIDGDLVNYINHSNHIAKKLIYIEDSRLRFVESVKRFFDRITYKKKHGFFGNLWRVFVLIWVTPGILLFTIPIRAGYSTAAWRTSKKFHHHFIGWLAVYGRRKR